MHKKHMWLQQAFEVVSLHTWIWHILNSMGNHEVLKHHIKKRQAERRPSEKHHRSAQLCQSRTIKHQIGVVIPPLKISIWLISSICHSGLPANYSGGINIQRYWKSKAPVADRTGCHFYYIPQWDVGLWTSLLSGVAKNIMFFLRMSLEEIPLGHKRQKGLSTNLMAVYQRHYLSIHVCHFGLEVVLEQSTWPKQTWFIFQRAYIFLSIFQGSLLYFLIFLMFKCILGLCQRSSHIAD